MSRRPRVDVVSAYVVRVEVDVARSAHGPRARTVALHLGARALGAEPSRCGVRMVHRDRRATTWEVVTSP